MNEEIPPLNPTDVVRNLGRIATELTTAVDQMRAAELDLVEKRGAADLSYSREFLAAVGSVEARKHLATVATHEQRMAADVADALVKHLRRRIDVLKVRIDVGRSYGAAVRAEISLAGQGEQP